MTGRPTDGELRAAGASLMARRLRADLEALPSTTRRGRLALRLARWHAAAASTIVRKRNTWTS